MTIEKETGAPSPGTEMMQGVLVKGIGSFYTVRTEQGNEYTVRCKKRFRRERMTPMVGDSVRFTPGQGEEHGWLEESLPRVTECLRPPVANVTLLVIVIAPVPEPDMILADRQISRALSQGMKVLIVVNKSDLDPELPDRIRREYAAASIPVYGVSALRKQGLQELRDAMEAGGLCCLTGQSGAGKSTLLSLMAGLMLPTEGEILFNGKPTTEIDLNRYRRENAAVIYQSFRLLPLLTVTENVTYPMELRGFKGKKAREKAAELIEKVGLPENVLNRFPNMLSGGEQQRVAIARAMSMETRLMLADEPTGNLDTENSRRIIDLLLKLAHEEGYCVVVVTHDPEISSRADVTFRIRDGVLYRE